MSTWISVSLPKRRLASFGPFSIVGMCSICRRRERERGLRVWSTQSGGREAPNIPITRANPNIPITHATSNPWVFSAQDLNKNQSANDRVFISYQLNQGHKRLDCRSLGWSKEFGRLERSVNMKSTQDSKNLQDEKSPSVEPSGKKPELKDILQQMKKWFQRDKLKQVSSPFTKGVSEPVSGARRTSKGYNSHGKARLHS